MLIRELLAEQQQQGAAGAEQFLEEDQIKQTRERLFKGKPLLAAAAAQQKNFHRKASPMDRSQR